MASDEFSNRHKGKAIRLARLFDQAVDFTLIEVRNGFLKYLVFGLLIKTFSITKLKKPFQTSMTVFAPFFSNIDYFYDDITDRIKGKKAIRLACPFMVRKAFDFTLDEIWNGFFKL